MSRTYMIEVERTVTYRRKVWVQVEKGDVHEAKDAAVDKSPTLAGWEPHGETEYRAASGREVESAPNLDIIV